MHFPAHEQYFTGVLYNEHINNIPDVLFSTDTVHHRGIVHKMCGTSLTHTCTTRQIFVQHTYAICHRYIVKQTHSIYHRCFV